MSTSSGELGFRYSDAGWSELSWQQKMSIDLEADRCGTSAAVKGVETSLCRGLSHVTGVGVWEVWNGLSRLRRSYEDQLAAAGRAGGPGGGHSLMNFYLKWLQQQWPEKGYAELHGLGGGTSHEECAYPGLDWVTMPEEATVGGVLVVGQEDQAVMLCVSALVHGEIVDVDQAILNCERVWYVVPYAMWHPPIG